MTNRTTFAGQTTTTRQTISPRRVVSPGRIVAAALAGLLTVATIVPAPAAAQQPDWWHATWQMADVHQITDGAGITVALIDSGVNADLPDLADAVIPGIDLTGLGHDGTTDIDPDGHGTAMASLIASRGTDTGLIGVAPAVTILPIATSSEEDQRLDRDGVAEMAEAIRYAADQGAHVINVSLRGQTFCPDQEAAAVRYAVSQGAVVLASSGNIPGGSSFSPASCPGVVTVGAVTPDLGPWDDSHRSEHVDVAAPGVDVSAIGVDGGIEHGGGTSGATALVSGVVALIRAEHPDATPDEVVTRLLATTQDLGEPGRDDATGHGLVQPLPALTEPVPPEAPNPVYEGIDFTDTDDPLGPDPTRPAFEAPPDVAGGDQDDTATAVIALVVIGGVLLVLLIAGVIITLLAVRVTRRRRQPTGPPGPVPPGTDPPMPPG